MDFIFFSFQPYHAYCDVRQSKTKMSLELYSALGTEEINFGHRYNIFTLHSSKCGLQV